MHHPLLNDLEMASLVLVSGLSILKGAPAERASAVLILAANVAGDIAFMIAGPHIPKFSLFYLDLFLAVGLLAIAFRFSSLWLGAAMLLQSVILFAHALSLNDDEITPLAFLVLNNVVSWLMYACLLGATLVSWRGRVRGRRGLTLAAAG